MDIVFSLLRLIDSPWNRKISCQHARPYPQRQPSQKNRTKKQSTLATPYGLWLAAMYAHLIHRPVHSFRGQVQKAASRCPQGFAGRLESFFA
ncbi:hypothetical protein ACFS4T_03785 [Pseudomonas lini]